MDPSIVGAIISAFASIIVAVIGLKQQSNERAKSPRNSATIESKAAFPRVGAIWLGTAILLSAAALMISFFNHYHHRGIYVIFLAPVVFALLAFFCPIRPFWAAAFSLVPFPFAFVAEPLYLAYHETQAPFGGLHSSVILFPLGMAAITAFSSAAISRWRWLRLPNAKTKQISEDTLDEPVHEVSAANPSKEIAKLWKLHRDGALTEDEFREAKKKILSSGKPQR